MEMNHIKSVVVIVIALILTQISALAYAYDVKAGLLTFFIPDSYSAHVYQEGDIIHIDNISNSRLSAMIFAVKMPDKMEINEVTMRSIWESGVQRINADPLVYASSKCSSNTELTGIGEISLDRELHWFILKMCDANGNGKADAFITLLSSEDLGPNLNVICSSTVT